MRNITYQIHNEEVRGGALGNLAEFYFPQIERAFLQLKYEFLARGSDHNVQTLLTFQRSLRGQNLKRQMINTNIKDVYEYQVQCHFKNMINTRE